MMEIVLFFETKREKRVTTSWKALLIINAAFANYFGQIFGIEIGQEQ